MMQPPRIWALLGAHAGDNNQVLALAEALGRPFEIKALRYNHWRHLRPHLLGATLRTLDARSRTLIGSEPPDLTISTGHRSVPVVQYLRACSGGRTRSVHIGYPRVSAKKFDLVVTTAEYPVPDEINVLRLPFSMTRVAGCRPFDDLPAPRRLLILGGPTLYWTLKANAVLGAVGQLERIAARDRGSVIVVASPRTPDALLAKVGRQVGHSRSNALVVPAMGPPGFASLLAGADELFVTADSVAMISDAIATGKPVGIIPIEPTTLGRTYMAMLPSGARLRPRDLRFFWRSILDRGLAGTVEKPRSGPTVSVNAIAARRVSELLEGGQCPAP